MSIAEPPHAPVPTPPGPWTRSKRFLRTHPILCLMLISPGVPEYLTGSSQLSLIFFPPIFLLILGINLASYPTAILLIREAKIRWKKGWASVLLLGAAYALVNEGLTAATLYNPVGAPAVASDWRWLAVAWVLTAGLLVIHAVASISTPMIALDLALPETRGRSLIGRRGAALAVVAIGASTVAGTLLRGHMTGWYAGPYLWGGTLLAIAGFVYLAYRCPPNLLKFSRELPSASPWAFALLGGVFLWALLLFEDVMAGLHAPVVLPLAGLVLIGGGSLLWVLRHLGRHGHEAQLVGLCGGLIVGMSLMGLSSQIGTGIGLVPVLAGDVVALLFVRYLWRKYRPRTAGAPDGRLATPPAGTLPSP